MDSNVEDKMYHQIEKSLSNNINESLFVAGRGYEDKKTDVNQTDYDSGAVLERNSKSLETEKEDYEYAAKFPQLSRAEYIRQAREACLRQMTSVQIGSRGVEDYTDNSEAYHSSLPTIKKSKSINLFQNSAEEENSPQEIAAFRSLIIRTVCAIVLFISVFVIDKLEVKWGDFSNKTVQEYVTGIDQLEDLETLIVSWLK